MSEAFSTLGINPIFLLGQIVNFLILFVALRFLLWKPIMKNLDETLARRKKEKAEIEAIEETRASIQAEKERVLEVANQKAQQMLAKARQESTELKMEAEEKGERRAESIIEEAREQAKESRNRILGEARDNIAAMVSIATRKIVSTTINEEQHRELMASFFSNIEEGQFDILPQDLDPESLPKDVLVTVTSAVPLTEEEQKTIQRELAKRLGEDFNLSYQVQPEILGGVVVQVGDYVLDDSVAWKLEELQKTLVK
ncbi:MAG: ATP synthase subunit delta [Chloroflexi bacterium]|nr:ATP synthase subunit delta [Chloroflexota bacterium]